MSVAQYVKNFISDRNVASVAPTSSIGVRAVCKDIEFSTAKLFVEYGPGGGVFTKHILQSMREDAKLLAIELNPGFVTSLNKSIKDPRCEIVQENAQNVIELLKSRELGQADYILSGIPFSFMTDEVAIEVLKRTAGALAPGGQFLVYQVFIPPFSRGFQLKKLLEKAFPKVEPGLIWRNIPPLCTFKCTL